jgi:hypothetical protein
VGRKLVGAVSGAVHLPPADRALGRHRERLAIVPSPSTLALSSYGRVKSRLT